MGGAIKRPPTLRLRPPGSAEQAGRAFGRHHKKAPACVIAGARDHACNAPDVSGAGLAYADRRSPQGAGRRAADGYKTSEHSAGPA
jgi:hypothetical protein